ncbi:DUF6503 family protein [Gramella jeungdoensis]|uniref:DUF6503 family protein n=1 Tax=Gramella jeungdoensis TaxID=708091 RepID=A0ABT0Z5N3_9FLAO|nr:DUF6503 family protein [Gramella jeungdoensis]MCM8571031.1 DUF6503 family protein [Gramella jeungdoensis]
MKLKVTGLLIAVLFAALSCKNEEEKAEDVVLKSIAYHDPSNKWKTFSDTLNIELSMHDKPSRFSKVVIDFPNEYFSLEARTDTITKTYIIDENECILKLNGRQEFSSEEAENNDLNCDRANLYKDYYEYLYGLPMKLLDLGTNLESLEEVTFMDKEYLKVNVTYDEGVGSDVWNFYFNPQTYALEAYQFFKTDETSGEIIPDSGEYILLEGIEEIEGIKMPKTRRWFYNSNDKLLGTDILR